MTGPLAALAELAELLAQQPAAGRDHRRDMDWCVDCAEWVQEHGASVERHVQDMERIIEYASLLVWHDSGDGTGAHLSADPAYWPQQDRLRCALEERSPALGASSGAPSGEKEEE